MAKDEVKLKVVELAKPTGTAIKVRELQFKTSTFLGKVWQLRPVDDYHTIMEPRDGTEDLIYLNTFHYSFEIIKDGWGVTCLRITKRGE